MHIHRQHELSCAKADPFDIFIMITIIRIMFAIMGKKSKTLKNTPANIIENSNKKKLHIVRTILAISQASAM
jgi:hypothetical protein